MYLPQIVAITFAIYLFYQTKKRINNKSLPPIAPGYVPVLGHLLSIMNIPIHQIFSKWCQQVGPIYTCYFGSQTWIVLNSFEAIKDLIVDRGNIYSSRNLPDTLTEDFFQGENGGGFAFFKYGANWRRLRRIAHGGLVRNKINNYQPILDERRTVLLSHLYERSYNEEGAINRLFEYYSITSILSIAFGDMCSFELGDPVVHQVFGLTERVAKAISPSDQLREFFPILKTVWPVKRDRYFRLRDEFCEFYGVWLDKFKKKFHENQEELQDCFVKDILISESLTDLQIMYFVGVFVGAGSDTTATTLEWLIAFLANHPQVQDKAFEEIKKTVGLDRLPEAGDELQLPYLQCIIMETLRLRPPAPISIPHANTSEDCYKNWVIPKDSIIIMNLFAANQDQNRFPDPQKFNPDRHWDHVTNSKQVFTQSIEDRPHLSFSTGRRVCVGIHLAERSLFMAVSMMLACFKFERVTKAWIDTESPSDIHSTVLTPCHYKVRIVPRHDRISQFI